MSPETRLAAKRFMRESNARFLHPSTHPQEREDALAFTASVLTTLACLPQTTELDRR